MKFLRDDKREQRKLEARLLRTQRHSHVAVGVLQDEPHDDKFSMVDLAMVHEYGSPSNNIPARSFVRSTCDAKRKEHLELIRKLQSQIMRGRIAAKQALTQLGEVVSKDMVQTINEGIEPGIADATKAAKIRSLKRQKKKLSGDGFTPLIETGRLKGAITHEIRGGA